MVRRAMPNPGAAPLSRLIEADHGCIACREAGDASRPAIVLLHGLGGNAAMWRRQYAALSDRFRVLGWDMPGYGGSDPLPGMPGPAEYARALAVLLDKIGVAAACVVGQSAAALIAASLARARPERVAALVLAHPLFGFGALPPARRAAAVEERAGAFERLGPHAFALDRAPRLLAPGAPKELVAEVVDGMAAARPAGYRQAVAMMANADLPSDIARVAAPVTVIAGAHDPLAPPERCRSLGAHLVAVERAGHYAALERPDAFNAAVAAAAGGKWPPAGQAAG